MSESTLPEVYPNEPRRPPQPEEAVLASYSTSLAPIYITEQLFFYVLLHGGKGNPFHSISAKWFSELAAIKLRELLTPSSAVPMSELPLMVANLPRIEQEEKEIKEQ